MKSALLLSACLFTACAAERTQDESAAHSASAPVSVPPLVASASVQPSASAPAQDIAEALFDGAAEAQRAAARAVAQHIERGADAAQVMKSGNARIDGEWSFATRQMAALGLAQVMLAQPALGAELRPALRRAVAEMIEPGRLAFATAAWHGERGLDALLSVQGHAYLGYAALALCLARAADPELPERELADRLIDAFISRLNASKRAILETYPGETYPPDMAMVAGAIALCGRTRGIEGRPMLARVLAELRTSVEPSSGLLVQRVDRNTGGARDAARGSGTALAAYALAFADASFAAQLTAALATSVDASVLGFAGVREYTAGTPGNGDADSGPLFMGISPSATAFAIGSARIERQRDRFVALVRTADFFGAPEVRDGRRFYTAGGALGDAILLAMTTSGPMTARACEDKTFPCPAR